MVNPNSIYSYNDGFHRVLPRLCDPPLRGIGMQELSLLCRNPELREIAFCLFAGGSNTKYALEDIFKIVSAEQAHEHSNAGGRWQRYSSVIAAVQRHMPTCSDAHIVKVQDGDQALSIKFPPQLVHGNRRMRLQYTDTYTYTSSDWCLN